jgi:hypothetical protein
MYITCTKCKLKVYLRCKGKLYTLNKGKLSRKASFSIYCQLFQSLDPTSLSEWESLCQWILRHCWIHPFFVSSVLILTKHLHHQWLSSPLLGPGLFFSVVIIFAQTIGLLRRVICSSQGRYLHKTKQTQNKCTHRHPCLEWDSNSRSQCSSEWRYFVP